MLTREEGRQRTRESLIDAGLRLADRVGLSGMSVNRVVEEAGVSKGTFFHHFGDRSTFLLALHRGFHDRLVADIEDQVADSAPGAQRLLAISEAYLDACLRHRGVRALLLEARAEQAIGTEIMRRNDANADLLRPDFEAMGRRRAQEGARLWSGLLVEAALVEFEAGKRQSRVRAALGEYLTTDRR